MEFYCCIRFLSQSFPFIFVSSLSPPPPPSAIKYINTSFFFFFYFIFLQEQKQSQLNEHAKFLKEIEDERLKLQEERARNEIAKTLQSRNADDKGLRSRAEIDAAVKYAEVNNNFSFDDFYSFFCVHIFFICCFWHGSEFYFFSLLFEKQ